MQNLFEHVTVTGLAFVTGIIMSDATWGVLIAQVGIIAMMLLKDRRDIANREQDRLDRKLTADLAMLALHKGETRKDEIVNEVRELKKSVTDAAATASPLVISENPVHQKIEPETKL